MFKPKLKILNSVRLILAAVTVASFMLLPAAVSAAPLGCTPGDQDAACNNGNGAQNNGGGANNLGEGCNKDKNNLQNCLANNQLVVRLREVVNFLAAGVGVLVVMMIIVGGIQYTTAGDNPSAVQEAKKRIYNAVFGLLAFAFLWAFLQWLIPGGLLNL